MLKHKRRERREEKRRENKRGRRSLCWSFGFSFPGQCLRELLQWDTQKLGKLELEKLQLKKVLIPKCGWITVHSQAESWLLLEVDDAGSIVCSRSHTQ